MIIVSRRQKPPDKDDGLSQASDDMIIAREADCIPVTLVEKMYQAWTFERASRFEPELETMLRAKLAVNDQAGFHKIVRHYSDALDADLAEARAERRNRLISLVVVTATRVITTITLVFFPPKH